MYPNYISFIECFNGMTSQLDLYRQKRKKEMTLSSISAIIDEISEEELFKNVDKRRLFEYFTSRLYLIDYDIKKDELYRRTRKIMSIEVMSRIYDGLSPEQVDKLSRSFR